MCPREGERVGGSYPAVLPQPGAAARAVGGDAVVGVARHFARVATAATTSSVSAVVIAAVVIAVASAAAPIFPASALGCASVAFVAVAAGGAADAV